LGKCQDETSERGAVATFLLAVPPEDTWKGPTDPEEASAYLNAAPDERSDELFLLALRNIGEAQCLKKEGEDISLSDLPQILSRVGLRFSLKTI
jgi:hypothetical protein